LAPARQEGLASAWQGGLASARQEGLASVRQEGRYSLRRARCPVLGVPQPATAREMGLGPAVWPRRHRGLALDRALREWDTAA
jgi:hypothetical protein